MITQQSITTPSAEHAVAGNRLFEVPLLGGILYRTREAGRRGHYAARALSSLLINGLRPTASATRISAVIVGRNDDYQPDFQQRLHATVGWNLRRAVDEVVFVEWNPPADRELLSPQLACEFPAVRCFVVPRVLHTAVCRNDNLQLMEYHAKNVGLRRAQGDWCVAMNADVALAPDAVRQIRRITESTKESDRAWTATRYDIPWSENRQNAIGLLDCVRYRRANPYQRYGTGDFLMASRAAWERARGYDEALMRHRIGCDVRGAAQLEAGGVEFSHIGNVLHLAHPTSCTEGIRAHHGVPATTDGVPYLNSVDWGLGNCNDIEIEERIWKLER